MAKLNQVIAISKGVKAKTARTLTDAYHALDKPQPFAGIARSYRPKDEDGDRLPSESVLVQRTATGLLNDVSTALTRAWDVSLTQEQANQFAKADIVVGGATIASNVPVTGLLYLEKQFTDLRTFIAKVPVLDPAEKWHYDAAAGAYATEVSETTRTKKVPRNHVKAAATDKHPAQVEMFYEDQIVGYWATTKFSGALPRERKDLLLERVDDLINAVKYAREQANSMEVTDFHAGERIFGWLLAD